MQSFDLIAWWSSLGVLLAASGFDLWTRRIPNWLTLPFLFSGVLVRGAMEGAAGLGRALAGVGLVCAFFAVPCFLRFMGMGDLKLIAGVGAWVGPRQLLVALVVTFIAGGVMAVAAHFRAAAQPGDDSARSIPYAPAIAIGALFSFFAV